MVVVKIKRAAGAEDIPLPRYATPGSAAFDLSAAITEDVTIAPGHRFLVPTGLHFEIPEGYEMQVRPRSGLALKYGISFPNSPATIDSDFRGELKVIILNLGQEKFLIKRGDRIAQAVISPVTQATFQEVKELNEATQRGHGGFGSTGR